jgi:hypothetical protein
MGCVSSKKNSFPIPKNNDLALFYDHMNKLIHHHDLEDESDEESSNGEFEAEHQENIEAPPNEDDGPNQPVLPNEENEPVFQPGPFLLSPFRSSQSG